MGYSSVFMPDYYSLISKTILEILASKNLTETALKINDSLNICNVLYKI